MQSVIEHQTKPASEWICGRVVQKVSPQERHARAQGRLLAALVRWTDEFGLGRVGSEWEFRVAPPGEDVRTLVPDIAYLSYERIDYHDDEAAQMPAVAPDVTIEIVSPNDRRRYIDEKIRVYLASGTQAVILVYPEEQTAAVYDAAGVTVFDAERTLVHRALPGFAMPVRDIFAKPKPRG